MLFRSKVELDAHIQNKHADQAAEQADSSINVSPPEKKVNSLFAYLLLIHLHRSNVPM